MCHRYRQCAWPLSRIAMPMWCIAVLSSLGHCEEKAAPPAQPGSNVAFDNAIDGDRVTLPVNTLGRVRPFLLDTGSSISAYDSKLTHTLKKVGEAETSGGLSVPLYEEPGGMFGPFAFQQSPVGAIDLCRLSRVYGKAIEGIIGMPDLCSRILQIDFDNRCCTFLESVKNDAGDCCEISSTPGGCPRIKCEIDASLKVNLLVDTGSNSEFVFDAKRFDALEATGGITIHRKIKLLRQTVYGTATLSTGTLRELRIGTHSHQKLSVVRDAREGAISTVGVGYLSRFLVTLDFPQKKIYFKPGKQYDRESWHDALGATIDFQNDAFVVVHSAKESPASEAGIIKGDVILEINGRKASEFSLFEVQRQFGEPGKEVEIKLRRVLRTHSVKLLLRNLAE